MLKSSGSRTVAVILLVILGLELQVTGKLSALIGLATSHAAPASSANAPGSATAPASSANAGDGPPLILASQHIPAQAAQGDPIAQGMTF